MPRPRWELWVPLLSAALCAAVAFWWGERLRLEPFDDAYITLRASVNWARGHGPVFNPGERVESATSPLWTALLALGARLGADPAAVAGLLGTAFAAAAAAFCAALASAQSGPWAGAVAGVLLAALPTWSAWPLTGMEVPLAGCALAVAVWASLRSRPLAAGLAGALAALSRPEAMLLLPVLVAIAAAAAPPERRRRAALLAACACAAPLAVFFLARHWYFGAWLPNTYVAKRGGLGGVALLGGLRYLAAFALVHAAIAAAVFWGALRRRLPHTALAAACMVFAGAVAWEGGDHFGNFRLLAPALPLACALAGIAAADLRRRWVGAALLATSAAAAAILGISTAEGGFRRGPAGPEALRLEALFARRAHATGEALAVLPAGTVATLAIGAVGYFSDRAILDLVGLADVRIARSPHLPGVVPGHDHADVDYVLSRRPELALFIPQLTAQPLSSAAEEAWLVQERAYFLSALLLLGDPRFRQSYAPLDVRLGDGRHLRIWQRRDLLAR